MEEWVLCKPLLALALGFGGVISGFAALGNLERFPIPEECRVGLVCPERPIFFQPFESAGKFGVCGGRKSTDGSCPLFQNCLAERSGMSEANS